MMTKNEATKIAQKIDDLAKAYEILVAKEEVSYYVLKTILEEREKLFNELKPYIDSKVG